MQNITSLRECFTIDLSQWKKDISIAEYLHLLCFDSGYFAVVCYRLARYFKFKKFFPFGRSIPLIPNIFYRLSISKSGWEINPNAEIDSGLIIDHSMGIVVGAGVKIGKKAKIFSGVTIGGKNLKRFEPSKNVRYPVIGDEVVIFSGAKVLGGIRVGNNVTIGANAVVIDSVPDGARVAGVPARVISGRG